MTRRARPWSELERDELLRVRVKDLGLDLASSPLQARFDQLLSEFDAKGIAFRPYAWLSTDWFCPDGLTGFAVPFFLAHPRLVRLERSQMLEVEGGSAAQCMKLMRHEAAHAIDNAYGLRRRRDWRETFGRAGEPYRASYSPDPTSRASVLHLNDWYSQSHPLEDFAETFAVWLAPGSRWRRRYAGWPAMKKLEYVDRLMAEVGGRKPKLRTRAREEQVARVGMTLGTYYDRKKRYYADEGTPAFDGQLARTFPGADAKGDPRPRLATLLGKKRRVLVGHVSGATGQHRYLVDHVVSEMVARAKRRDLRLPADEGAGMIDAAIVLTSLTSQFLYGGHPKFQR
ncbi:MAG: hypothetical protein AAFR54_16840 [Planctomycetota bacterium]